VASGAVKGIEQADLGRAATAEYIDDGSDEWAEHAGGEWIVGGVAGVVNAGGAAAIAAGAADDSAGDQNDKIKIDRNTGELKLVEIELALATMITSQWGSGADSQFILGAALEVAHVDATWVGGGRGSILSGCMSW